MSDVGELPPPRRAALEDALLRRRAEVDEALSRWLPPESEEPTRLHAAMRYAVFSGGKRLRPVCCLLAAEAAGGDPRHALPAACALELVHTYSLVHDDLPAMDDDDLRRGRATLHKAFDEASAILAGDALLTLAFEVLGDGLAAPVAGRAAAVLARASGSRGMAGGQAGDLEAEGKTLSEAAVLAIDARKTGALFEASFRLGAIATHANPSNEEALRIAGAELGVAFQIVDDLLDLRATDQALGKRAGKDQARGKATLPALLGQERAFEAAVSHTRRACDALASLPSPELILDLARTMLLRSH